MRNSLLTPALLLAAAISFAPLQAQESGVAGIDAAKTEQVRAKLAKLDKAEIEQVAKAAAKIATDQAKPTAERIGAIRTIGLLQSPATVPALQSLFAEKALADDARAALQRIPGPATKTALLEGLGKANDPKLQAGFIDSLGALRATVAIATLKGYVNNPETLVAEAAQRALAAIGTPDGFAALATAKDSDLKRDLQISLGAKILECPKCEAGRPAVLATLRELSKNTTDSDAAFSALLLRYRYQDADAAAGLLSDVPVERRAAATFLNGSRDIESGKVLEKALANAKSSDLGPLLGAVANRRQSSALPILKTRYASEADATVKGDIIKTIGQIGGAAEVAFFANLLSDSAVGAAAKDALGQVRGPGVGKAFTDLIADTSKTKDLRIALLSIVQSRQLRETVAALLPVLNDSEEDIRFGVLKNIDRFAGKQHIESLEKARETVTDNAVKARLTTLIEKLKK